MTRRGIATVWALVILAVVSVMTTAIAGQMIAAHRALDANLNQVQATLLAEAGELHAKVMLKNSKDYKGETNMFLKNGQVVIAVTPTKGGYRVAIEAKYPTDQKRAATKRVEATITLPVAP